MVFRIQWGLLLATLATACDTDHLCPPHEPGSVDVVEYNLGIKYPDEMRLLNTLETFTKPLGHSRASNRGESTVFFNRNQRFCGIYVEVAEMSAGCFLVSIDDQSGTWTPESTQFVHALRDRLNRMPELIQANVIRSDYQPAPPEDILALPELTIDAFCEAP